MITISTDKNKLDISVIHSYLTKSYWGKGRTIKEVAETVEHSLCFGVYENEVQIGFGRVVTDYVVFAYIMDIFILPEYRGNGYSKELMRSIIDAKELEKCKTWMLKTSDTHGLYSKYDFKKLRYPGKVMERIIE